MRTSMSDVAYDLEQGQRFVPHLAPTDYWQRVGENLDNIEAAAEIIARRVRMMDRRPAFDTCARAELDAVEGTLKRALEKCQSAKAAYDAKPQEVR